MRRSELPRHAESRSPGSSCSFRSFGVSGSQFDFAKVKMSEQREQCQKLEQQKKTQRKKINPKVMNMIERQVFNPSDFSDVN